MRNRIGAWRRIGVVVVAASLLCAGCSTARTDVGTSDESCYTALPTAADAVGSNAHFVGVRKYTMQDLDKVARHVHANLKLPPKQTLCIVAYSGHFTSSDVSKPLGHPKKSGSLAVPIVKEPGNQLVGTLILDKIPLRLQHTHPF